MIFETKNQKYKKYFLVVDTLFFCTVFATEKIKPRKQISFSLVTF